MLRFDRWVRQKFQAPLSPDQDLSRLVETSLRLARMNTMLMEAQQLSGLGTWSYDLVSLEVTWSRELYLILGLDPASQPLPFEEQHKLYSQSSWQQLCQAVKLAIRDGCPYEVDLEVRRPDGRPCWVRARGERSRTSRQGNYLIGTLQDITEFKRWT
ncbi:hypothetical protein ABS71_10225 [bacterium SCN 62-11]|nr:PAS domain-containing protein [Candidatus Eremiobacteraeota bacterium]ODT67896.1 MAG: hypothetical protein ABS71_10225 [bacterium SCN 62-11]